MRKNPFFSPRSFPLAEHSQWRISLNNFETDGRIHSLLGTFFVPLAMPHQPAQFRRRAIAPSQPIHLAMKISKK